MIAFKAPLGVWGLNCTRRPVLKVQFVFLNEHRKNTCNNGKQGNTLNKGCC